MRSAVASRRAALTAGKIHSGAWDAYLGHHANAPRGSPQSAGFSMAHAAPAASASPTRCAVNMASVLFRHVPHPLIPGHR
eukprot:6195348-Pleurochrysis_carterae.AAC.2